jgi:hypothetical protein
MYKVEGQLLEKECAAGDWLVSYLFSWLVGQFFFVLCKLC